MYVALIAQLVVTVAILRLTADREVYPSLWKFVAAVVAGFLAGGLVAPLVGSSSFDETARLWLISGPLTFMVAVVIWVRLRWVHRKRRG